MAGWSIRRKLGLLVIIPMIALLVGGGLFATSIGLEYRSAHISRTYADILVPALATETALGSEFASPGSLRESSQLTAARGASDESIRALTPGLEKLSQDGGAISIEATNALKLLGQITPARDRINTLSATKGVQPGPMNSQMTYQTDAIKTAVQTFVIALTGQIAATSPDQTTSNDANVVSALSQFLAAARSEQSFSTAVYLGEKQVDTGTYGDFDQAIAGQNLALSRAESTADRALKKTLADLADAQQSDVGTWRTNISGLLGKTRLTSDPTQANNWLAASGNRIDRATAILNRVTDDTQATARESESQAVLRAALVAAAVIITLIVVSALLATIARTVTGPLRRLRAGAVDIASVQLPAAVARIEQDGVAADVSLPPVLPADAKAGPETFEVARAVDDLGAEAVRLATAQVRLRRALDEAFVSMSRRSQSMVEKQLAIIDDLESQEQDPDQLRNLFRLDHLAARMRRYNDNLLVLAGSAVRTRATAPVKVAELFRAATSEMEQYERVRLQPVSGASIAGTVAGELVHLLAELLDNAAMYSPPSSPIVLSAAFTADGGLQIEVLDAGVGISPGELDRLNARLTQPEAIDTQVPSRMGLFVVARLARRGGFGVMLQSRSDAAGTIALVRVPATLVVGAPGSTGEQPSMPGRANLRPATPAAGGGAALNGASAYPAQVPSPSLPMGTPSAAATAAAAAAAAAAGIRVSDAGSSAPALPKRRRGGGSGLPPGASATPSGGDLFTPATPNGSTDLPSEGRSDAASPGNGSGAGTNPSLMRRPAPPETTPTGIPALGTPTGNPGIAPPPAAGRVSPSGLPSRSGRPAPNPLDPASPLEPASPLDPIGPLGRGRAETEEHPQTPAAGINGLPGLDAPPQTRVPVGRSGPSALTGPLPSRPPSPSAPSIPQDPLTTPSGEFRAQPNPAVSDDMLSSTGDGAAPAAWDSGLPTELAARAAAAASYRPADPDAPMIGEDIRPDADDPTPIFDQISVWFTAEPTGRLPVVSAESDDEVIDLRSERQPSSRWASLGDQRWLATNARAAAAPDTEGTTETGLPLRRPGANLLPSASAAAPAAPMGLPAPGLPVRPPATSATADGDSAGPGGNGQETPVDADLVRGRLGSYQRGLANARRARSQQAPEPAFDPVGASLFTTNSDGSDEAGRNDEQGADQ